MSTTPKNKRHDLRIKQEMFRTQTLREAPAAGVDRGKNVIRGAKVIQAGAVNDDRPFEVDEQTLDYVVAYGNRLNKGLKARFTHPNMSDDGMGRYLGRWQNFRVEGDAVLADLHVADVAFDTPHGDLGSYVLDLAEEDPEAFGVSLATVLDESMFADPAEPSQDEEDEEDGEDFECSEDKKKRTPLRFAKLFAADVVDEPAATRGGLFDVNTPQGLPYQVTWIMDRFFKHSKPQDVIARFEAFLKRYYSGDFSMSENETIAVAEPVVDEAVEDTIAVSDEAVAEEETEEVTEEATEPEAEATEEPVLVQTATDLSAGREFVELFGDQGATWFIEGKSLPQAYSLHVIHLREQIEQLAADNADLRAKLDVALKLAGEAEPLSAEPDFSAEQKKKAKKEAKIVEAKKKGATEAVATWAAMYDEKE